MRVFFSMFQNDYQYFFFPLLSWQYNSSPHFCKICEVKVTRSVQIYKFKNALKVKKKMALRHKLLNLKTGRILYKQPECIWIYQHKSWSFFFFSRFFHKFVKSLQKSIGCLSTVATYYLGTRGCCSDRHVCCRLCCHVDGCHSGLSAGDSCPGCGRVAGDGRNSVHLRSADFCRRCSFGNPDADRGCWRVALSPLCQNFHLQATASAEAWRSRHSTAQAAACGAATSRCSSTHWGQDR